MEGISVDAYRGIKGYWRRKRYDRQHPRRRKPRVIRLGSGTDEDGGAAGVRRRFWRIRFGPRLKLRRLLFSSPKRFLLGLRDAYVNMMMRVASSRAVAGGGGYCSGGGYAAFDVGAMKEYRLL